MHKKKVVVLGTGFAALEFAFQAVLVLVGRAEITLISKTDTFFLMPNWIFVPFGMAWEKLHVPLREAFARRGIRFLQGEVTEIDTKGCIIKVSIEDDGFEEPEVIEVAYDKLVIGTGSRLDTELIPGLYQYGLIVGTDIGADTLRATLQELKKSDSRKRIRILFVNPGSHFCAGPLYETLFMVEHWLKVHGLRPQIEVMLYTAEETFVAAFGPGVHHQVKKLLAKREIPNKRGMKLAEVRLGLAVFEAAESVEFDILIALSPQVGTHFGLPHTEKGFIRVNRETLQVIGQPNIYAIGDANDFPLNQGFLAMLQANAALRHLIMRLTGNQSSTFEALTMCIMHQGNTALFVQAPLRLTGKPNAPIAIDGGRREKYLVGTSPHWLMCKRLLGMAILESFRRGHPFHGGRAWKWFFGPCLKITTKLLARQALKQAD